jgi:cytidine deaminase
MLTLDEAGMDAPRLSALRRAAEAARATHYAPYSHFLVLAAVETKAGIFGGSNCEIANYSLTKHAEETAVLAAITAGVGPKPVGWLKVLYVVGGAPCGSCRQFVYEFGGTETIVVIEQAEQAELQSASLPALASRLPPPDVWWLGDLLPAAFGPEDLGVQGPP